MLSTKSTDLGNLSKDKKKTPTSLSRIAKYPVSLPKGVEAHINGQTFSAKGKLGDMSFDFPSFIGVAIEGEKIKVLLKQEQHPDGKAMSGTVRAIIQGMVEGVANGFSKKLELNGVGYRAQAQAKSIQLSLGFSHPVVKDLPVGVSVETPTPTEIIIKGIDKRVVGQVAAEIRAIRPVEPYKGKGVRYANERVQLKEAKKK